MNATRPVESPSEEPIEVLKSSSLPTLIQEKVERMILEGELNAGERLNESDLALRFGVSRGPIREALRTLEESGLVQQQRNRGVFVREISVQEADDIYELRELLDELVGRKLAKSITVEQLEQLRALLGKMDEATSKQDVNRYYQLNLHFHDLMVTFAGNPKLTETYARLVKVLLLFRQRGLQQGGGLPVSIHEHHAILDAIASRDADRAGQQMREHVRASRRRMHKAYGAPITE